MHESEWLSEAQSVPVGRSKRIYHGAEHRPNLVVSNKPDRWTAYCFACKEYAEKRKDFVRILEEQAPDPKEIYGEPEVFMNLLEPSAKWLTPISDIAYFLHTKHMSLEWLRPYNPRWDCKRKRLVLDFQGKTIGRDIYGNSRCKWYDYRRATSNQRGLGNNSSATDCNPSSTKLVITEDAFSAIKGQCAVPNVQFIALMGTTLTNSLETSLLHSQPKMVYLMLDGDEAGRKATIRIMRRLEIFGIACKDVSPEVGDPKDYPKEWYIARLNHSESIS